MGVSKIVLNNELLLDLTGDTVTPENVLAGVTFHGADGEKKEGTMTPVSKKGDTMQGALVAQNNTNYDVKQVRNIFIIAEGEDLPEGANGDICLYYVP